MLRLIGLFFTFSALSLTGLSQDLIINEFMASNSYGDKIHDLEKIYWIHQNDSGFIFSIKFINYD